MSDAFYNLTGASVYRSLFVQTQTVTVSSTTAETTLIGAGVGNVTLPAGFFVAGKSIGIKAFGIHSSAGGVTIRLRIKLGSTTILDTGATNSGNDTDQGFSIDADICCRTSGVSGTVIGQGYYLEEGSNEKHAGMVNTTTTTIDTTAALAVNLTAEWSTSSASNSISCTKLYLDVCG